MVGRADIAKKFSLFVNIPPEFHKNSVIRGKIPQIRKFFTKKNANAKISNKSAGAIIVNDKSQK